MRHLRSVQDFFTAKSNKADDEGVELEELFGSEPSRSDSVEVEVSAPAPSTIPTAPNTTTTTTQNTRIESYSDWIDLAKIKDALKDQPGVTVSAEWENANDLQQWRRDHQQQNLGIVYAQGSSQFHIRVTEYANKQLVWSTSIRPNPSSEKTADRENDIQNQRELFLNKLVELMQKTLPNDEPAKRTTIDLKSVSPSDPKFIEQTKLAFLQKFKEVKYDGVYYHLEDGKCVEGRSSPTSTNEAGFDNSDEAKDQDSNIGPRSPLGSS